MVKKASPASGNGGSRRSRTSAANAAQGEAKPAGIWGGGALPLDPDAVSGADGGFTTDNASGQVEPKEGDHATIDGVEAVFTMGEWQPAGEEVPTTIAESVAPKRTRKPRATKGEEAPKEEAEAEGFSNMTNDLVKGVEGLERLAEEIDVLKEDAKELMSELKSKGYSPPIIREAIRRRSMDPDARSTHDSLLNTYEEALRGS